VPYYGGKKKKVLRENPGRKTGRLAKTKLGGGVMNIRGNRPILPGERGKRGAETYLTVEELFY